MFPGMETLLMSLLGSSAFGGPGGPGGMGDAPAAGAGGGAGGMLGSMGKTLGSIAAPQGQKPIMNAGVSGVQLPFSQAMNDTINPALNAGAQRRASAPMLPTFAQLLAGG